MGETSERKWRGEGVIWERSEKWREGERRGRMRETGERKREGERREELRERSEKRRGEIE